MLPLTPTEVKRIYHEAQQRLAAGDRDGAEALLRKVLAAHPDMPEALFAMGRIAMARGRSAEACVHFARAARARPTEAAIWQAWAQAAAPDKAAARAVLKQARGAGLDPRHLAALERALAQGAPPRGPRLGTLAPRQVQDLVALVNAGQLSKAEQRARALRQQHPDVAILADIHANTLARLGQTGPAQAAHEAAIRLDPDFVEARIGYGRFLSEHGEPARGVAQLRQAVTLAPGNGAALVALGLGLIRLGTTGEAIEVLTRAVRAQPKAPEPQFRLGQAYLQGRDYAAAASAFDKAIALGDRRAATYQALAQALDGAGRPEDALAAHDKAVAAAPDRPDTHGRRAIQLQQMGRFDEAEASFRRAIERAPQEGESYRLLVKGRKIAKDDPLIAEMETLYAREDLSEHSRMNLAFALAKAMEDSGQNDRVFGYLHRANALMRALYPYDITERRAEIDRVKAACARTDFTARRVAGTTDYAPIFVTGMPRSGTTLVEQIIASHSRVTGGGELGFLVPETLALMGDGAGGLRDVAALDDAELAGLGRRAEAHFRMRLPGSDIVTDKSIQTYLLAGPVHLALPNARIVVVHRDPRDTCLSIYKNIFAEGTHGYAYALRDLGLYYRMFLEIVAFWREKLPGVLYEIRYEDLIADPEGQARALIAACGLDWEDACLASHRTERRVATLSLHQVRQPIYASSMKAWQRHEDDLAELIEALGDAVGKGNADGA
ncbi:Tfp pilus assembly protein PilF [Rhodovulum bhavnagarense]|uniref:Tfp pilus assembly protein PilF n=1 Tax=Rhodovulum bhavnagarense TaxID=992286 RepID=A0A4R2RDR8_9RHOB|nr:tetratricopeptide repeat-containing sulfotransferase family protein [Rhodovulum bhavnagarense]TCP61612.1 Tfp pilus assembly protein PilF [Rhodovulum bhavnagarense]